jgi:hemerythrin HHE cation binding domain-containing protein
MPIDQFIADFRAEHRKIRDIILELVNAFQDRNKPRIQTLVEQFAGQAGPHFRYEEEALYPAVAEITGRNFIEELLWDHDNAIAAIGKVQQMAAQAELSDEDVHQADVLLRSMVLHTSNCDGLAIIVERLPEENIRSIVSAHARAIAAGLPLMTWAAEVRERPPSESSSTST